MASDPLRLDRVRDIRLQKPVGRFTEKRERAKAKLKAWREVCRIVMLRDNRTCRVCKRRASDTLPVDPHHIVFKSAGGADSVDNTICCCRTCHDEIHSGRLFVSGKAHGTLKIERQ